MKLLIYFIVINVMAFIFYGWDKQKAIRGKYRISESVLLGLAAVGGSFGALAGMRLFHHKTRKPKFFIGVPVLIGLQLCLAFWLVSSKLIAVFPF